MLYNSRDLFDTCSESRNQDLNILKFDFLLLEIEAKKPLKLFT